MNEWDRTDEANVMTVGPQPARPVEAVHLLLLDLDARLQRLGAPADPRVRDDWDRLRRRVEGQILLSDILVSPDARDRARLDAIKRHLGGLRTSDSVAVRCVLMSYAVDHGIEAGLDLPVPEPAYHHANETCPATGEVVAGGTAGAGAPRRL